jgi:isopentenyldiphosphate isomerase
MKTILKYRVLIFIMEFLDVVDDKDEVIGKASRKEVYEKLFSHRIVHVIIFNNKGEMALQLRSRYTSFCPNHWGTPVGGHVQSGESYEQAALREFREELGTTAKISFAYKDLYNDPRGLKKFLVTFRTLFNGSFRANPKEVEKVEYFNMDKIQGMINSGDKFHPELLFLLRKHFKIK